jgi:kynurenine formamidase
MAQATVARTPAQSVTPEAVLEALRVPKAGRVFDLDIGRFNGMPVGSAHTQFIVTTYRTPRGLHLQDDQDWLRPDVNMSGWAFLSDLVIGTTHSGTHMDALCHVNRGIGDQATWYGDVKASENVGDFGALRDDAAAIPPIVVPGVLLDVAKTVGRGPLPAHYGIGPDDLARAAESVPAVPQGSAVLVRTGHLKHWPDTARMAESDGAGITLDGAQWIFERYHPVAVGGDTPAVEQGPSSTPGNPAPVHNYLLRDRGVHILENVALDGLSAADATYFLFVCLPLAIHGATGSLIRPIAIV